MSHDDCVERECFVMGVAALSVLVICCCGDDTHLILNFNGVFIADDRSGRVIDRH